MTHPFTWADLQLCKSSLQHMACRFHGGCAQRVHFCKADPERHKGCEFADLQGAVHIATGIALPLALPEFRIQPAASGKKSYKVGNARG